MHIFWHHHHHHQQHHHAAHDRLRASARERRAKKVTSHLVTSSDRYVNTNTHTTQMRVCARSRRAMMLLGPLARSLLRRATRRCLIINFGGRRETRIFSHNARTRACITPLPTRLFVCGLFFMPTPDMNTRCLCAIDHGAALLAMLVAAAVVAARWELGHLQETQHTHKHTTSSCDSSSRACSEKMNTLTHLR